ncbi:hypothetical protein ACFYP4_22910 [Streptomyces sp. NPDC005551]|uniref:hypothetical protein n=1 Tax=Streptomyces sp. NPDC005551 TaxID=3364725 RepID=UPI0036C42981
MTHTPWFPPPGGRGDTPPSSATTVPGPDGEAAGCPAASLPPRARLVLLDSRSATGVQLPAASEPAAHLSVLPAYRQAAPAGPAAVPGPGEAAVRAAPRSDPPDALIRMRFADALTLERAGAVFGAVAHPGPGEASCDLVTLTLQIPGDAGVQTLRAVLAALDAAALTPESLTVHTHELDDLFAAFTSLP